MGNEESGDIVEDIYGDFELPDYSYDKPSEQISPKINWHGKVISVQEACAKCFAVHTLKFEIIFACIYHYKKIICTA